MKMTGKRFVHAAAVALPIIRVCAFAAVPLAGLAIARIAKHIIKERRRNKEDEVVTGAVELSDWSAVAEYRSDFGTEIAAEGSVPNRYATTTRFI
jgi:hypothetical protein